MKLMLVPIFLLAFLSESIAQKIPLFNSTNKWILVTNQVENDTIFFTPYDSSKVSLNTMIWQFAPKHKIEYDYQSNVEACAGVDFLDLDSDQTFWTYNPEHHTLILTVKGGYASIEDFKFKREYDIESKENGDYLLRKVKEYYYNDLTSPEAPKVVHRRSKRKYATHRK